MKKTIAHSVYPYLFITGSWIYSQLTSMEKYEPMVITDEVVNIDIFPLENIYCVKNDSSLKKFYIKAYKKLNGHYFPFVYSTLKNKNIALIHSHFGNIGWQDILIKKKLNIPQITTFYGYDVSQLSKVQMWQKRYKKLFKECDLFIVEGKYMKQSLVDLGCKEEKIVVHHLGIDLEKVKYIPRKIDDDGTIRFLIAGTFREKKGIPYAVEAFAKISKKYRNVRLTIIGDANSKKENIIKKQIIDIIKKYKIEDHVKMLGYLPYETMLNEARKHHIFISPSVQSSDGDNEGGAPVAIIEMNASGMPVISTWHCDIPSVLIDGKSGFLVKERNVEELVENMDYLINNPDIWVKMGQQGRKHIEKEYDIRKQIVLQENIYDKLMF